MRERVSVISTMCKKRVNYRICRNFFESSNQKLPSLVGFLTVTETRVPSKLFSFKITLTEHFKIGGKFMKLPHCAVQFSGVKNSLSPKEYFVKSIIQLYNFFSKIVAFTKFLSKSARENFSNFNTV